MIESGLRKINWANNHMPILKELLDDFRKNQYFSGLKITICIHLEAKTANFALLLKEGGATVTATACNPLSTQDDVCAALKSLGVRVFGKRGMSEAEYNACLLQSIDNQPDFIVDDGGDLTNLIHEKMPHLIPNIIGGTEETTTGVTRLKTRAALGNLKYPVISVNDAHCKYLFDNRYGTGQSVWDGINRTTNLIVSGKNVVVAGYGWCGKGVSLRAKGLGANVIVTEIDPVKALEAHMDGFSVMTMEDASKIGDVFVTVTGCKDIITKEHLKNMKDGVILANAGHFDVEINKDDLMEISTHKLTVRENIEAYIQENGTNINLLAEGRLVNLAAGDGHPAEIMDMSFAVQALSLKYLLDNKGKLKNICIDVPSEVDNTVAMLKLKSLGKSIDRLSESQKKYIEGYE